VTWQQHGQAPAPTDSEELRRIVALPRRASTSSPEARAWLDAEVERMTSFLLRENDAALPCRCAELYGVRQDGSPRCIRRLLPIQAAYLREAQLGGPEMRGVVGEIAVGGGKTGIDLLLPMVVPCRVALLLVPASLVHQIQHDYERWSQHFRLPNLVGHSEFRAGRPVLEVMSYSKLGHPSAATELGRIRPDLFILDESHNIKRAATKAAMSTRSTRFFAACGAFPNAIHCHHSGTATRQSILEFAHSFALALRDQSPVPRETNTLASWAAAIDSPRGDAVQSEPGALQVLCAPGESVRQGFRRRRVETPGVISTNEIAVDASLYFHARTVEVPARVRALIAQTARPGGTRPDGEIFLDGMRKAACLQQLAAGFYYYWYFPRGEPRAIIDQWFAVRTAYRTELADAMARRREGMDSPHLFAEAATRWHDGYEWDAGGGRMFREAPHSSRGPLPVWPSEHWPQWRVWQNAVVHETRAEWVDDFLAADAAEWANARGEHGIVWYDHAAFGERVAQLGRLPHYRGGMDAEIKAEPGGRSIVASIEAHGTGKNLQDRWHRNLVANYPRKVPVEQLLGRTHREGQERDVEVHWYRHADSYVERFDELLRAETYVDEVQGQGDGRSRRMLLGVRTWE